MKRRYTILIAVFLFTSFIKAGAQLSVQPVKLIFDTDMGPDYDDAGAISILHALADSGEVEILATIASTKFPGVAGVLNVFNTYFGRPALPVGVPRGKALELRDFQHWTDTLLAKYPHQIKTNDQAADATDLYRRILASQPDKSVTIVTVGFLTNLAALLNSPADRHSSLPGKELVSKKVKQLVCMAGRFPAGKEFNVEEDAPASRLVFETWPTPILFSGFEIGANIKTGLPLVRNAALMNNPAKDVFRISIPLAKEDSAGRMSWDQTAVLVAIRGYRPWYRVQEGKIVVAADGSNTWNSNGKGHFYLVEDQPYQKVRDLIDTLMQHVPADGRREAGLGRPE